MGILDNILGAVAGAAVGGENIDRMRRTNIFQQEMDLRFAADAREAEFHDFRMGQARKLAPLDAAIQQLRLESETLNLGQSRRAAKDNRYLRARQAQLEAQFPQLAAAREFLPLANQYANYQQTQAGTDLARANISSLGRQLEMQEEEVKLRAQEAQQLTDALNTLTGLRNNKAAAAYDISQDVDGLLGAIEEGTPGLTFSAKERRGLMDLAQQGFDAGLDVEEVGFRLQEFIATRPRFLERVSAFTENREGVEQQYGGFLDSLLRGQFAPPSATMTSPENARLGVVGLLPPSGVY